MPKNSKRNLKTGIRQGPLAAARGRKDHPGGCPEQPRSVSDREGQPGATKEIIELCENIVKSIMKDNVKHNVKTIVKIVVDNIVKSVV